MNIISRKVSWTLPGRGAKVKPVPVAEKKVIVQVVDAKKKQDDHEDQGESPPHELKRKNTLTPRAPCCGSTPQAGRRATIPSLPTSIPNITTVETASV